MIALLATLLAVVNNPNPSVSYACDGVNPTFVVNFPYLSRSDLVVTSTTAGGVVTTLVYTTDFTTSVVSTQSTASLVVNAPATKCPSGSVLKIARRVTLTQPTGFRAQTTYNQSLHEDAYDRLEMQIQQVNAGVANPVSPSVLVNSTPVQASNIGTTTPIQLQNWFSFMANSLSYGVKADGTDISSFLNSAISNNKGIIYLPPNATCYNIAGNTINMASGVTLLGGGMGTGSTQGPTCIVYTGTGTAIMMNDTQGAAVRDLELQLNTASGTSRAIVVQGTALNSQDNEVSGVSLKVTNASRRNAGQLGLLVKDNGAGAYWNTFRRIHAGFFDVSFKQEGGAFGSNANHWEDLKSYGHNTAYKATGSTVTDNRVFGMHCSRSDGTSVGVQNCGVLGDDGTLVDFNFFYGITSDQGVPSTCFTMGTSSWGNVVEADCQSGNAAGASDSNTNTTFKNRIYDTVNAATPGTFSIPRLATTLDANVIGTFWTGITPTTNVTGGIAQFKGGTGGPGNNDGGTVYLLPGVKTGTGANGGVVIGNTSSRGVRIQATRVTPATKNVAPVDCGGAGIGATTSQILDGSIFTCATAQNLTMPTSQGANGIVQNLAGATTTAPPAVGDLFQFYVSSTAAANFTLVAGAGGTIVGNAVINNASKIWTCRVTSVTGGAETLSCY